MPESLKFSVDLPVSTERAFRAWLDSYEFSRFTGSPAQIDPQPGGKFTQLGGEIHGQTIAATPFSHIVQIWKSTDFPAGAPDSQVDIIFEPTCLGCQLTLVQTGIPDGLIQPTLQRWETRLLRPLKTYFDQIVGDQTADMDG